MFVQMYRRVAPYQGLQGGFHGASGGIGRVYYSAVTVATFLGEMVVGMSIGAGLEGKGHALVYEPAYGGRSMAYHEVDGIGMA